MANAAQESPDLIVADKLLAEAYTIRTADLNKSIELTQAALEKFTILQNEEGIARSKNQLGLFYSIHGKFDIGLELSKEALQFFEAHKSIRGQAEAKYNIGSIYYKTDNCHQGLLYLLDCLQFYRQLNDYDKQALTLKSIGAIYEFFNDTEKAIESYQQSIDASLKINALSTASNAYNPLSGIYLKQGFIELALETIENSIAIKIQTQDIRGLGFALYGRGKIFSKTNQFQKAIADFNKAEEILTTAGDTLGMGMVYNKRGIAHMNFGEHETAKTYFLKAIHISEKFNIRFILFKGYFNLYGLAKKEGDATQALGYLEKYLDHKETVINSKAHVIIKSYDALSKVQTLEHEARTHKEKNEIIERKNAELDSFFYRVSHDLKGPISSLLGLYGVVEIDIKDAPSLQLFKMYHSQVTRMNNIVMGLINLTEINNTEKLKTKIDFSKLIEECIESCHYLSNSSAVKINKEIQPFIFNSEWAIINTILQNLIENAIKYSKPSPDAHINIKVSASNNEVMVVVEDNGQGIPLVHQNNIFNMFYRANDNTKGSGLGLYILKRAVERLNGVVELKSIHNIGSSFTITLPLV